MIDSFILQFNIDYHVHPPLYKTLVSIWTKIWFSFATFSVVVNSENQTQKLEDEKW